MVVWASLIREGNVGTWRPIAGSRILLGKVENEASGAPTPETGTPETAMEEKETSGTWRPGAGARILSGTVGNETSGTSTSEIAMEEKKRRGRGDQVLVLEFCQGQWGMKRRDVNARNWDGRNCDGRKEKRRGRGDQVLVLEFCQGQWGMKRRGRQRQRMGHQKLG